MADIQCELQKITDLVESAAGKREFKTDHPVKALPDNYKIHSLESHMKQRNAFRGTFVTSIISDFYKYCEVYSKESICFVNRDEMKAVTIFDMGAETAPGHCQHKAFLNLREKPAYAAALNSHNKEYDQRQFFNFASDWVNNVKFFDSEYGEISHGIACQKILNVELTEQVKSDFSEGDMSASRSNFAKVEMNSKDGKLPNFMTITCVPYDELNEVTLTFRIYAAKGRGEPCIKTRCEQLDDIKDGIAQNFANLLSDQFRDRVIFGEFDPR